MNAKFYNYFLQYSYLKAITALLLFFFTGTFTLHSQSLQKAENLLANKNNSQWSFEENRGQLADENGVVLNDIKYYGRDKGVSVYLRNNKISFVFSKTEVKNNSKPAFSEATGAVPFAFPPPYKGGNRGGFNAPEEVKVSTSRIDLEIIGANPNTQIIAEEKISYYTNYYLAHTPEEGITHVPHYKKLTYRNIYSNIDLVLYVKEKGMKYEFVVHPKGKVSDIKLSWNGTKPDVLANRGIKYASALGEITESKPFTFVSEDNEEVKSAFKVKGNVVGFEVGRYDEHKRLVIDPMLVWGTYYGGSGDDLGFGIASDSDNGVYICGYSSSTSGISTIGTHQTNFARLNDVFISKFSQTGVRQWGTYYGGEGDDRSFSLALDKNKNIFITGWSTSTLGIATTDAHQTKLIENPNPNIGNTVVAKFNNNGIRQWGTYYGLGFVSYFGRGGDIVVDGDDNVFICGSTQEDTGFTTIGAHQTNRSGGSDAFVAKFNNNGVRIWGTYYGGSGGDYGIGINVDKSNNVYITGSTTSVESISTQNVHQSKHGNWFGGSWSSDAFVVKFNSNGIRQWGTYYGGEKDDNSFDICSDFNGNVYIIGQTHSATGIATSGTHQAIFNAVLDVFIAKFNTDGVRQWGTYFGREGVDVGCGIITDGIGNIYITGITNSTTSIADEGTHQVYIGGGNDAFVAKFNSKGIKLWGTYFGGNGGEIGYGISCKGNSAYITGNTFSSSGMTTNGAHQISFGGGGYDAYIVKFGSIDDAGIVTINSPQGNTCGGNFAVQVKIKNFSPRIQLDSVRIGWSINGIAQKDYNWQGTLKPGDTSEIINIGTAYFKGGNNILKVWTMNPNGVDDIDNSNDTLTKTIYFYPTPEAETGGNKSICIGNSATIGADAVSGNIYSWTSNPSGLISSQSKLTVTPTETTTYYLTETDTSSGCKKEDSVTVTVHAYPVPLIAGETSICGKSTAVFQAQQNPGSTYSWEAEGGSIVSGQSTNSITLQIDKNTTAGKIKLTETNAGGCAASKEMAFTYKYSPLLDISKDKFICEGQSKLIKLDSADNTYYRWYPDENDTSRFIIIRKVNNYYVVIKDNICNQAPQEEIKIYSKCGLFLVIFPNPAQQHVTIKYSIPESGDVKISLYDRLGKEVIKIADGFHNQGVYKYRIDATELNLSAAIYAVRMLAGQDVIVKQFILLK